MALKTPIYIGKVKYRGNGRIKIEGNISRGMIKIGFLREWIFPHNPSMLNIEGEVIFKGSCIIGQSSSIRVHKYGTLIFGDLFKVNVGFQLVCINKIQFGNLVGIGYNVFITDTDFHSMKSEDGKNFLKGYGTVIIEDNVWIASFCKVLKNTKIPSYCTLAGNTVISKKIKAEPYSLIYNLQEVRVEKIGYFLDRFDDPDLNEEIKKRKLYGN